jgi:hypothetical protein
MVMRLRVSVMMSHGSMSVVLMDGMIVARLDQQVTVISGDCIDVHGCCPTHWWFVCV